MKETGALLYLCDLVVDAVDEELEAEAVVLALELVLHELWKLAVADQKF